METFTRLFSVEEADALVTRLEVAFAAIEALRERLREVVERMREMGFELKVTPLTSEHMENAELRASLREALGLQTNIRQHVKELEMDGIEVKHLSGLVDLKVAITGVSSIYVGAEESLAFTFGTSLKLDMLAVSASCGLQTSKGIPSIEGLASRGREDARLIKKPD